MAKPSLLSLALSLLLLFHGSCLARHFQNECQFDRLQTLEPASRIESEGGVTEWWNPNHQQFKCAGVAVVRHTIGHRGLVLPVFHDAPQLVYVVQGRGIRGVGMPGCPETFQESQESQQGQRRRFQDQHQKIQRVRQGDIITVPAGMAHWCYNDGNEALITVNLLDVGNSINQLDMNPRKFYLAGNPQEEYRQLRKLQQQGQQELNKESRKEQQEKEKEQESEQEEQERSSCGNILCKFDPKMLARAFNVDLQLIKNIQDEQDNRGPIIRVKDQLYVSRPPMMDEEQEEQSSNGLEETFCTMRTRENIGEPTRADIYSPKVGRITTLNSFNLPILRFLQLSAERIDLQRNACIVPHWCTNANKILYMLKGSAWGQVVDNQGNAVFNGEVSERQILTVPMNFAVTLKAGREGAEWVSFNTNDNAMSSTLAGRTSAIGSMPLDVIKNSYQISSEEANKLKFSNPASFFCHPDSSSESERRADA